MGARRIITGLKSLESRLAVLIVIIAMPIFAAAEDHELPPMMQGNYGGYTPPQCHRLPPRESAIVNWIGRNSPTGVTHSYRLTRLGQTAYKTEINLKLLPAQGENIAPADIEKLRGNITKCLKAQSPHLKGPNQETLEIALSEDPTVPQSEIHVTKLSARADSGLYPLNAMICPTILHEILHLHGLVDEYREQTIGVKPDPQTGLPIYIKERSDEQVAFDCRALGPSSSVMNNQLESLIESQDFAEWEFATCQEKEPRVRAPGVHCPAGKYPALRTVFLSPGEPFTALDGEGVDQSYPPRFVGIKKHTRNSILEPAQFLAITRPGCMEENALYYMCSMNAYASSEVLTGISFGADDTSLPFQNKVQCLPLPKECSDPNRWLSGEPWHFPVMSGMGAATGGYGIDLNNGSAGR